MLQLLTLALGIVAYLPLLRFDEGALERRVEEFLFIPSDTSTVAVLVLALWLTWRRWGRLRGLRSAGAPGLGAALLTLGIASYAWARLTLAGDLLVPSLALNSLGVAAWYRGRPAVRVMLLPAAFLLFAMPIPPPLLNEIVYKLQLVTAEFGGWMLSAVGQSVFVTGDQIIRPEQRFAVIEGCSGMRSMETLTMIAFLLVDLFQRRGLHAVLVVLAAPPVAYALNGLRVLVLMLNPHSEIIAVHTLQGVAILLCGLVLLYLFDGWLARRLPAAKPPRPDPSEPGDPRVASGARAAVPALALGLCVALSLWLRPWPEPPPVAYALGKEIPAAMGEWHSTDLAVDHAFLGRAVTGQILHRQYRSQGDAVDLFVSVGERSSRQRSPFSPTTGVPGSGWLVEELGRRTLGDDGPEARLRLASAGTRRVVLLYWYEGTRGLVDETLRSALALDASPLRREGAGVVVRIATPAPGGEASLGKAEDRLMRFLESLRGELATLNARLSRKTFS